MKNINCIILDILYRYDILLYKNCTNKQFIQYDINMFSNNIIILFNSNNILNFICLIEKITIIYVVDTF